MFSLVLVIDLNGKNNIDYRKEVNDHVNDNWDIIKQKFPKARTQSLEAKKLEIKKGFLSQYIIRKNVGLEGIDDVDIDYSADLTSPNGIKIDVKMEGITIAFQEEYIGTGDIYRQAKHNFYPRQLFDPKLATTDLFLVTRLRTGDVFPGSGRSNEKKWKLWVCGWVSKKRVKNEGVLIPRGGITEQGQKFFDYRSHNVEFYQYALNKVDDLSAWFNGITKEDVKQDEKKNPNETLQCTSADGQRIISDLLTKNVITRKQFDDANSFLGLTDKYVPPILHTNHTIRFVKHLITKNVLSPEILNKLISVGITETKPESLPELERFFNE